MGGMNCLNLPGGRNLANTKSAILFLTCLYFSFKLTRLQISAGHRTFVRQIWGFDRETAQPDQTPWWVSPMKIVISLKKANFNIWLWWILPKFYFYVCPLKAFISLNCKHVTPINIHAVRTSKVAGTVYWNWFKFKKKTGSNYRTVLEMHFGCIFIGLIRFTGSVWAVLLQIFRDSNCIPRRHNFKNY